MKRFFILAVMAAIPIVLTAQNKEAEWKERIMSEKIAFFTTELQLTPEEAQAFWPVYNTCWEKMNNAHHKTMRAYRVLSDALKNGRPESEIETLLEAYRYAISERNSVESSLYPEYCQVLPPVKVARLYVAEEKFRRQQIHKLHHHNNTPRRQ